MNRWFDGHLDLAYLQASARDLRAAAVDESEGCVSLPALRHARVAACLGTIYTEPFEKLVLPPHGYIAGDADSAHFVGLRQLEIYEQLEREGLLRIVKSGDGGARNSSGLDVLILVEGADPIREPAELGWWVDRGVQMIGLTWATGSRYAGGNSQPGPLTSLGREMIGVMDELGVVHDLSHLADEAADELLAASSGRVSASHSNVRSLLDGISQRHLRDDQIAEIGRRGGMVGLNLYSKFLAVGRRATIEDALNHVEHVADVMGHRRGVGLGSDMDGGFGPADLPIGLDHPSKLPALAEGLRGRGWSDGEIADFAEGNWRRFWAQDRA